MGATLSQAETMARINPDWREEETAWAQGLVAVGIDEVGRGPLAGPLLAAAVAVPPHFEAPWLELVRDSKQLSARQRERLAGEVQASVLAWGTGEATVEEIDRWGMSEALMCAIRRAIAVLPAAPRLILLDGRPLPLLGQPHRAIIDGDAHCYSIAMASVIAKVARDRTMRELDELFPGYGLGQHKGYATQTHREALARLGPSPVHRRSFITVRRVLDGFVGQPRLIE